MRCRAGGWWIVLVLPLVARGQDSNFRPYLIGGRAGGMGGAFTALSDDGSGGYYNPGGLAFTTAPSISLSVNVYGLVGGRIQDALGDGHDFNYQDLNVFPVATAGISKLKEVDPRSGAAKHTLFISVFIPDGITNDDRDQLDLPGNAFFRRLSVQTLWLGGGYALRLGTVGLGFGAYGLLGSETNFFDLDVIDSSGTPFEILTSRTDLSTVSFVASAGVRWDVDDHLKLGLSLFTPAVGWGSRDSFGRVAISIAGRAGAAAQQVNGLHASPAVPLRVQAGAAWSSGPLTVSADVVFLGPRHFVDNPEQTPQALQREVIRRMVVNPSLGVEYVFAKKFPVRAGFFTDFAASDPYKLDTYNTSHVDHYGLTFSVGLLTEHVKTDLGLTAWYGTGTDVIPQNLDFTVFKRTPATEYAVFVSLATAYEF